MFKDLINRFFSLANGEESREKVLTAVAGNISFKGPNFWILACAIFIASIGLNVNSTAVIIGAMLISPLMGPIVGAGFALAIFDFHLLRRSIRNLLTATFVSLIVSTLYFYITPFKDAQSEILARTSPNIYDVLIAFVGGLVGVIALTRVEKGNPIPGVAIATALMPPLCTAGYGFATGNYNYSFGALFLFSINAVFICASTFVIVKILKYPYVNQIDDRSQRKVNYIISTLTVIMLVPSIYFAYDLYQKQKIDSRITDFINNEIVNKGNVLLSREIKSTKSDKIIELALLKSNYNASALDSLNNTLSLNYGLSNYKVKIIGTINTSTQINQQKLLKSTIAEMNRLELKIDSLSKSMNAGVNFSLDTAKIINEIKTLYPEIMMVDFYFSLPYKEDSTVFLITYNTARKPSVEMDEKLLSWLSIRLERPRDLIKIKGTKSDFKKSR